MLFLTKVFLVRCHTRHDRMQKRWQCVWQWHTLRMLRLLRNKLCERNYVAGLYLIRFSVQGVSYCQMHRHHFCIRSWRVWQRTRKTFVKYNIIWRYYLSCTGYVHKIYFFMLLNPNENTAKPFLCLVTHIQRLCLNMCCSFCTTHGQNKTRKCDTEGFVPVASLCGVVGSPSSFIRYLIGRTGKIWSAVYINAKWTYTSATLACTIRVCATVRNVLQVTSTFLFISHVDIR